MIIGDWIDSGQDIVEISLEQRRHVGAKALIKSSIGPWWRPSALIIQLARSFSKLLEDVEMSRVPRQAW